VSFCFFFNDTATTEIYTLSLHDALPICLRGDHDARREVEEHEVAREAVPSDRKSTRLNSSHTVISYAVFCLKKNKPRRATGETTAGRRAARTARRTPLSR